MPMPIMPAPVAVEGGPRSPVASTVGSSGERGSNLMATASDDGKGTRRPVIPFVAYAIVLALLGVGRRRLLDRGRGGLPSVPGSDRAAPAISKPAPIEPVDAARGLKLPPRPAGPEATAPTKQELHGACGVVVDVTKRGEQQRPGGLGGGKPEPLKTMCTVDVGAWPTDSNGPGQGHPDSPARSRLLWRHHLRHGRSGDARGDPQVPARCRRGRNR